MSIQLSSPDPAPVIRDQAQPPDARWVTIQQARLLVGVSRRTIYYWMQKGKLIVRRTAGGSVRIQESSLFRTA